MIARLSYFSEKLMLQGDNFGVIAGEKYFSEIFVKNYEK